MSTVSSLSSAAINSNISAVTKRLEAPITSLGTQVAADKALISAWGSISGAVSSLSDSLVHIQNISTINARAATSNNTLVATATANASAATGTYNLTSISLAKGQELYLSLIHI